MKNVSRKQLNDIFRTITNEKLAVNPNYFLPTAKKKGIVRIFPESVSMQSNNIKAGLIVEKFFGLVSQLSSKTVETEITKVGRHQLDLVLSDNRNVYYFEIKNNLELDNEKQNAVVSKMNKVTAKLTAQYPNKTINSYILHACATSEVANREYIATKHRTIGYDEFFTLIGLNVSNSDYDRSLKFLGTTIMGNSGFTSTMIKIMNNIQTQLSKNISKLLKKKK